jgi:DNA-binding response OmpR family regulator
MERAGILLVDDEPPLLRLMGDFLRHMGYPVDGRMAGKEALSALQESPGKYALIVVDLSLPDIPGEQLVSLILTEYPVLPILICSGLPFNVEELPPRVKFLQKPFLPRMLAQEIEAMIGPPHKTPTAGAG